MHLILDWGEEGGRKEVVKSRGGVFDVATSTGCHARGGGGFLYEPRQEGRREISARSRHIDHKSEKRREDKIREGNVRRRRQRWMKRMQSPRQRKSRESRISAWRTSRQKLIERCRCSPPACKLQRLRTLAALQDEAALTGRRTAEGEAERKVILTDTNERDNKSDDQNDRYAREPDLLPRRASL
jgi:hypothetical protein